MMTRPKFLTTTAFIFLFALATFAAGGDTPPSWLLDDARIKVPAYDVKDVPAVVLRSEEHVSVTSDGTVIRTVRYAVRILLREGRAEAIARAVYEKDGGKVTGMSAWLIRASGQNKTYGKKETIDVSLADDDVYDESRLKFISGKEDADAGDVFGYETVQERKTVFSQFQFFFQDDLPTIYSRFSMDLPSGWKAESVTFNRPKIEPSVNGTSYVWELRDLPPINHEPSSPQFASLSPRLAVSFFPDSPTATPLRTFAGWNDVAKWMAELEDPQMTVDDALAAKARDLTANAKTELERIQAIAHYVQQIRYFAVSIGAEKGGGYVPHRATDVFAKSYGDCKDKANLMRAMLSVVKIPAFMVSITADDPTYVRAEWASPHQFNHCIIAIKVSDETQAPSVVAHPKLGRLLIFDPTDPYTQVGDLPRQEQGSLALIDHKDSESLLQMPTTPPEMNQLERKVDITLSPEGNISGTVSEKAIGQSAVIFRAEFRGLSSADYNRRIEGWVSRSATGAQTTKITPADNTNGSFNLDVEFSARNYAQIMQSRLMVFKPTVIGRMESMSFSEGKRMNPYMIESRSYSEEVKVKLPQGFTVDEMPDAAQVETSFGKYNAAYEVKGEYLVFTRSLKLNRATVSPDKYDSVRAFFAKVHAAEQAPVVLITK